MVRTQKGKSSKKRLQQGAGIGDVLIKLAKVLGPSALKILEGAAEGVGKKVGKLISGEGLQGLQDRMSRRQDNPAAADASAWLAGVNAAGT